jgi:hypothetical protein
MGIGGVKALTGNPKEPIYPEPGVWDLLRLSSINLHRRYLSEESNS